MVLINKTYDRARSVFSKYAAFCMAAFSLFTIIFMAPVKETKFSGDKTPGVRFNSAHADVVTSDGSRVSNCGGEADSSDSGGGDSGCDGGGCDGGCD